MIQDNDKDPIIETYTIPDPSDDLADRIIMAARQTPQKKSWRDTLLSLIDFKGAPALSYSFASVILACFLVAGLFYANNQSSSPATQTNVEQPTTSMEMAEDNLDDLFAEDESLLIL